MSKASFRPELVNENSKIWANILNKLQIEFGEPTYRSWLSKLNLISAEGGQLILAAPTRFIREWILTHYASSIKSNWQSFNKSIINLDIIVANNYSATKNIKKTSNSLASKPLVNLELSKKVNDDQDQLSSSLEIRYKFDNFVVGESNQLAYRSAKAIAESNLVQPQSNPLFLYGGVGLGKTHLMNSIAWCINRQNNNKKVVYLSAERFMYSFIKALRNKDLIKFKEQFQTIDTLMIDDIQFICNKESTQEEFFHAFNSLINNGRQLIISADRAPNELLGIQDRLKSRLGWGLVIDIHHSDYELRLNILKAKLTQLKLSIADEVIEFLAAKITSNIRELEGALNKVIAHSTLMNKVISIENTKIILADLLKSNEQIISIEEIQKLVAARYNIKVIDMLSNKRLRSLARPRQIAMYLTQMLTSKSLVEIGRKFGNKDHTTVIHAIKKIESLCITDHKFNNDIKALIRIFHN